MPTNDFTFNGISASDYDIEVLDVTEEFTSRDGEGIPVSGRTGELYNDNGRYENVNVTYSCAIQLGTSDSETKLKGFNAKLLSFVGNYHLVDTFDDSVAYRIGRYTGAIEPKISRTGDGLVRVDFTFNCNPKRFLSSGVQPFAFTPTQKIISPHWDYDDFSSRTKTDVLSQLKEIGYTQSDIESMQYLFTTVTVGSGVSVRIEQESNQKFFALVMDADPRTAGSGSLTYTYYDTKSFNLSNFAWGSGTVYIILMRMPTTRVFVNNVDVMDYVYYDYYSLTNPTDFSAQPMIRAEVSSNTFADYLFEINGCSLYFDHDSDIGSGGINVLTIDEYMNVYSLPEDNADGRLIDANKFVRFSNYSLDLLSGENEIAVGDWCHKLEVTPRWWTL